MPGFYDIEWDGCYQLSLRQTYLSQLIVNRFFYFRADTAKTIQQIAAAFATEIVPLLQPIQSAGLSYDDVHIIELFGNRDSAVAVIDSVEGTDEGGPLPAFFGSRFRMLPAYTRVRKGRKIFAGVTEGMTQGNDLAAGYVTPMAAVATFLAAALDVDGETFLPVLLSPANTKHATDYMTTVLSAQYMGWSTQSSRKIGRGA